MIYTPTTKDAYHLLHRGSLALARVEHNGIRVDMKYLNTKISETQDVINTHTKKLMNSKVWTEWRKRYGEKANLNSHTQLGEVFFKCLGYKPTALTRTLKFKTDENAFRNIDHPFIKSYFKVAKLKKAKTTYLEGIRREVVDGFLHPVFNLHLVQTYRSSSDSPNFQNIPVRDPIIGELVRRCFIPRKGHQIGEIDYAGIEVRIAACYHKDKNLIKDILTGDMHKEMAAECYLLDQNNVTKQVRYCGKNMFVFPEFYGSYYVDCARSLWDAITRMNLTTKDGKPLLEHLKQQGILKLGECNPNKDTRPGTFEHHIKKVEKNFWEVRYRDYAAWKKKWFQDYLSRGWFDLLSGFRITGVYRRNEVINFPVQGFAFHCLLESLIRLQNWLTKKKMKTLLVGQIHDSIVPDIYIPELQDFLGMARDVMTKEIPIHWPSIIVPLEIEAEVAPPEKSWYEKVPVTI